MKKIRKGTFETNSSSMHSLVVEGGIKGEKKEANLPLYPDGTLEIETGEYGWGYGLLKTPVSKLEYLITLLCCTNGIETMEELEENDVFQEWLEDLKEYAGVKRILVTDFSGYVDHQSFTDPKSFIENYKKEYIEDRESYWDDDDEENEDFTKENLDFLQVIFDDNIVIEIANDNI